MIKILGIRRILTVLILAGIVFFLGAALYLVVIPGEDKTNTELRSTRAAIEGRRNEVQVLQTQYQEIQQQKALFGDLQQSGFFGTQDRVQARKTIEAIQAASHILSARYNINAVEVKENSLTQKADHVLLQSPVTISVDALDDIDVYSFLYWIENAFPGNTAITSLSVERKADIDETALKRIGNGIPAVLINANINFSWNTFVPKAQAPLPATQGTVQ